MSLKEEDVLVVTPIETAPSIEKKAKRGRPRKADIQAKKTRAVRGRPPGEAARIKEFHARLLTTSGDKVINTILRKALDDNDKDQVACLKMCIDRVLPMSYFEKEKAAGRGGINITISGLGGTTEITEAESVDAEDVNYVEEGWKDGS